MNCRMVMEKNCTGKSSTEGKGLEMHTNDGDSLNKVTKHNQRGQQPGIDEWIGKGLLSRTG